MSIIIFIIILSILVFVHELGHYLVAKKNGIRVDEFGFGYPPRIWGKQYGETLYSINALPFGGFVKIFGEDADGEENTSVDKERNFQNKSKGIQAAVLVAGVGFNVIFAWLLISFGFMYGLPGSVSEAKKELKDVKLIVTSIAENSPAFEAGLEQGDVVKRVTLGEKVEQNPVAETIPTLVAENQDTPITLLVENSSGIEREITLTPKEGLVEGKKIIGLSTDLIGLEQYPPHIALLEGVKTTAYLTKATTVGLASFIFDSVRGQSDFSQVAGPVGIVGIVGDATRLGIIYLLTFTALISINLAVINLIPFPALDGGRLLFVIIEAIKGSPINPKVANTVNAIGFALLLLLMVVVTYNDILKLF